MSGGNAEQLIQTRAVATRAFRLLTPADEELEFLVTFAAGVFVEGHGSAGEYDVRSNRFSKFFYC